MNTQRPGNGFEDRLLHELKSVVADNAKGQPMPAATPHRRFASKRNLSLAGAAGAVVIGGAAAIALPALLGGAAAYAVEPTDEGTVVVEINELKDSEGLKQALADAGIPAEVEYLPENHECSPDWYEWDEESNTDSFIAVGLTATDEEEPELDAITFEVDLEDFQNSGSTLMLSLSGDPEGDSESWASSVGVTSGEIGECDPRETDLVIEEDGETDEEKGAVVEEDGVPAEPQEEEGGQTD